MHIFIQDKAFTQEYNTLRRRMPFAMKPHVKKRTLQQKYVALQRLAFMTNAECHLHLFDQQNTVVQEDACLSKILGFGRTNNKSAGTYFTKLTLFYTRACFQQGNTFAGTTETTAAEIQSKLQSCTVFFTKTLRPKLICSWDRGMKSTKPINPKNSFRKIRHSGVF